MKPFSIILLSISAMVLTAGCSSVRIKQPLSGVPKPIDREEFEGAWFTGDTVVHVKFDRNGVAQIAGVDWKDNQFQIVHAEMIVRRGTNTIFCPFEYRKTVNGWMVTC